MSGEIKNNPGYNIFTIASDIKYFIASGFQTLPFTMAGTMIILGLFTSNYAMLFFLIGYLTMVPAGAFVINLLFSFVPGHDQTWLFPKASANCNALTSHAALEPTPSKIPEMDCVITYWMAMFAFFVGYVFTNAWSIYNKPVVYPEKADDAVKKAVESKTMFRQSQTLVGMIAILVITLIFIIIRLAVTGCDSIVGVLLSGIFAGLGHWWYKQLSAVGEDRLSDLFGIANRLMTSSSLTNAPYACIAEGNNTFQYST